jgi:uncharacterized protein (TIGR00255 family)
MPYSMTAFARIEFDGDWGHGAWELRSVNHRYAEVTVRAPEDFRMLETSVREKVGRAAKRGKIDCNLRVETSGNGSGEVRINEQMATAVLTAAREIAALGDAPATVNPLEILRWPGVTQANEVDLDVVASTVMTALDDAIAAFLDARRREGEKMADVIRQRLAGINEQLKILEVKVPDIIANVRERHTQRVAELADGLDPGRVEQECALLAQRLDVAEELDRLRAHVDEVERVLGQNEPIGRRLDFLMQELNREANTLGSKSAHIDTTGAAIELKVLIEQMREQVQNIE